MRLVNQAHRDYVSVRGQGILRTTLVRDWVCGKCGSRLKTNWSDEEPRWRTVCACDESHDEDDFIHSKTWAYLEHKRLKEAGEARVVFSRLPKEMQEAILRREQDAN